MKVIVIPKKWDKYEPRWISGAEYHQLSKIGAIVVLNEAYHPWITHGNGKGSAGDWVNGDKKTLWDELYT